MVSSRARDTEQWAAILKQLETRVLNDVGKNTVTGYDPQLQDKWAPESSL